MAQKPPKRPTDVEMKAKAISRWENEGGTARATPKQPKRPRDLNQWANRMVDIATGQAEDRDPTPPVSNSERASKGGEARAKKLTPRQRSRIAKKAAVSRWGKAPAARETTE